MVEGGSTGEYSEKEVDLWKDYDELREKMDAKEGERDLYHLVRQMDQVGMEMY